MNELMEKVEQLKKELDSSTLVLSLKDSLEKVKEDNELCSLLDTYQKNPSEDIRKKILENNTFQEFKIKETDLNLFIMEMNQRLKTITKKGRCNHESN